MEVDTETADIWSKHSAPARIRKQPSSKILPITQSILVLFLVGQLVFFLFYRTVNLDEGWYLWASKLVYEGKLLYRDFAYTQTPLLPYVYGLLQPLLGQGLYEGRLITICFSLLGLLLSARVAQHHVATFSTANVSRWAGLTSLLLLASSFYMMAYLSYTATYALASFFMLLALLAATGHRPPGASIPPHKKHLFSRYENRRAALAVLFICMAVATRLSVLGAVPSLLFYLVWRSQQRARASLVVALAVLVATLILVGPFLWLSGPQMIYDIFGFHTDRILSFQRQLTKMASVLQRTASTYAAPLLLIGFGFILTCVRSLGRRQWPPLLQRYLFETTLAGMALGMLILHLVPRTTDDYYNTILGPLLAILGASVLVRIWHALRAAGYGAPWGALLTALVVVLNGALHAQTLIKAELVPFPLHNQIAVIESAADFLKHEGLEGKTLLTLNTHLALEANMNVPSGYEMSIFSYRPTWSNEQALRYKAINNEILIRDLGAGAAAMAITDFDLERFYGERQRIFEAMWRHFRFAKIIPGFDPMRRNLYIYLAPRFTAPPPQTSLSVELSNGIKLLGYDLDVPTYQPGDTLYLGIYWQAPEAMLARYTIFVHIVDSQGRLAASWDNPPCSTTCPTDTWLPHEILRDPYQIPLPADWQPGIYTLMTGMYHSETGEPITLPPTAPQAEGQRIILGQIQVLPR